MRISKYTIYKENYPVSGYKLLYNTLTKAIALLPDNDFNSIGSKFESNIKDLHLLKEQGFIVDAFDDERSKLNMYFTGLKTNYFSYATMIYTTYDCNMRCPYCFENGIKSNHTSMTEITARDIVAWLEKEIIQYHPEYFSIAFSGGEPLLNLKVIKSISESVQAFCLANEINFQFGILTNGTVPISDEDATFLSQVGLSFIQYTIDGYEGIHNKRRIMEGGSYNLIRENMLANSLRMDIDTIIRVNVDDENHDSIDLMLDDLKLLEINRVFVDFAVRFETPCDPHCSNQTVATDCAITAYIKECMKLAVDKGFNHSRRYASNTPCLAVIPRQFVIDPAGDLYKCAAFAGEKELSVGSIYDDSFNDVYIDMVGHEAWLDCRNCPYVPLCGGGCLFINRTINGDYKKRKCQHQLFKELVMETLASTLSKETLLEAIKRDACGKEPNNS